jgi:predicted DNA-binding protein
MINLEALQSVRLVTVKGKRLAVLNAEDWEKLIEWLEDMEDLQVARSVLAKLKAVDNDYDRAGWLKWDDVEAELN